MEQATRRITTVVVVATLAMLGLLWAGHAMTAQASTGVTLSRSGHSIKLTATCSNVKTSLTKVSSTGGNPGYAPRIRRNNGTWQQGPEVSSGTTSTTLQAPYAPATGHGVRVFWPSSVGGAQNYTFSC